jgi:hypothetical protein
MTRFPRALSIAMLLILAACTSTTDLGRSTPDPTASPTPTTSPSPSPEPTPSASAPEEADSPDANPSATPIEGEGGFTYEANAAADALMLERFDCQNLDDGYQVDFPAAWNTNAEFGGVATCSWFAPTEYETGAPGSVPSEVAIEFFVIDGAPEYLLQIMDQRSGLIGATQPATRTRMAGNDADLYEYVIQLGPTLEEGPNLVARTSSLMGGDYNLNRAVLDRMMATMEFIGVVQ